MRDVLTRHHMVLFFGLWLLLGLLQSGLTELQDDEAYYWLYGQYLDWGYFDHPPMIGLLVKMGYSILPGELGVRLFPLLLNLFSLMIIERLTEKKNPSLFYAIALSIAVLQISGFVAVPDIPLIFFTALFFLFYKKFISRASILNTFLLGLAVALLLYSKYHAVLIVFFVLLSNLKLFTRPQTYIAGLIALILFAPHLWWQYQHDWVSFRYHLFESNVNAYKASFTLDYILGQLLLPGPIAGFILLPAAFLYKPRTASTRGMKFMMIGIYVFFLLSSFRGRVEGNWTSPALVPLIVLSHQFLLHHVKWRTWLVRLLPITIILVVFSRVIMIADFLPVKEIKNRYHSWKQWPSEMRSITHAKPIVFSNSYQRASKYWFYTGQMTFSQNWYRERRNSFNFWPVEDSLLGKPVYFLDKYGLKRFRDSLSTPLGWIGYQYDSSFISFTKINIETVHRMSTKAGIPFHVRGMYKMPELYRSFILSHENLNDTTVLGIFNNRGWIKDVAVVKTLKEAVLKPEVIVQVEGLSKGNYYLRFSIRSGAYNATHNSAKITLIVE